MCGCPLSGTWEQYLAFGEVQRSSMLLIEHERSRSELPVIRVLYERKCS